jgi:hypothetical protein
MFKQGWGRRSKVCQWLARNLVAAMVGVAAVSAVAAPSEGELRAAVIVAIMRFTAWPAAEKPVLEVCLVGKPISQNTLLSIDGEQKVAGRALRVNPQRRTLEDCQVLILGEGVGEAEYERLITEADERAILTVCDGCKRGLGEDAIIQLRLRQQKVSFEVNLLRARSSGIALDAQLLELATVVRK